MPRVGTDLHGSPPQVMATLHLDGQARKLDLSYRHGISLSRSRVSKSFTAITAAAALDLTEEDPLAAYERERLSHKERAAERELREEELQQVLAFLGAMEIAGDGVYTQKSARRGTGGEGTGSGAGGEVLELVMSARRSYLLLFSDPRDRDLLILTMRAYLREWPPKGSELATARPPPPDCRKRFRTNITVTADILPKSRNTERLCSSVPRPRPITSSRESITLVPPGWQRK